MSVLTPAITCAAFWLAIALHTRRDRPGTRRFVAALFAGAVAAHFLPLLVFEGAAGASILFLPLGPLAWRCRSAFECLPLPLAAARLGCAAAGCCRGAAGEPLPILEAAALAGLHGVLQRLPPALRPGVFLIAFGLVRLAEEPWRPAPEGAWIPPGVVALAWTLLGVGWAGAARDGAVTKP